MLHYSLTRRRQKGVVVVITDVGIRQRFLLFRLTVGPFHLISKKQLMIPSYRIFHSGVATWIIP
jgi:hypothetical protein